LYLTLFKINEFCHLSFFFKLGVIWLQYTPYTQLANKGMLYLVYSEIN